MSEQFRAFISRRRPQIEAALEERLPLSSQPNTERLNEALRYAIFPGGKRLRPMLTLLGAELVGATTQAALPAACAIEFLHTSSLIFDDLPAMDDADLRRGRPSLHHVFGEGVALLAALALLNQSYALLAGAAREQAGCGAATRLVEEAARCIGADGMIGGQMADLALLCAEQHALDGLAVRKLKTTALMRLTMTAGAMACGANEDDANSLARFGEALGMAYQICDDLMDELGRSDELGKPSKQDARHHRSTYCAELGVEAAHRLAASLIEEGKNSLRERFGSRLEVALLADAATMILLGAPRPALDRKAPQPV